jgi:hypothetical protein
MSGAYHPTLLHSCARASSAHELRFRVNYPNSRQRSALFLGLDDAAVDLIRAQENFGAQRVYRLAANTPNDLLLSDDLGAQLHLEACISAHDLVLMVSTSPAQDSAAAGIYDVARSHNIMVNWIILHQNPGRRPQVANQIFTRDPDIIGETIYALRIGRP